MKNREKVLKEETAPSDEGSVRTLAADFSFITPDASKQWGRILALWEKMLLTLNFHARLN